MKDKAKQLLNEIHTYPINYGRQINLILQAFREVAEKQRERCAELDPGDIGESGTSLKSIIRFCPLVTDNPTDHE